MAKKQIRITQESIRDLIRKTINEMRDVKGVDGYPYDKYPKNESRMPKQVRLNENQLREFVSYSVARLLREMKFGSEVIEFDFDPMNDEDQQSAYESVLENSEFSNIDPEKLDSIWPVKVKIYYSTGNQEGGDRYERIPTANVDEWEWIPEGSNVPEELYDFVNEVLNRFFTDGYFDEDDLLDLLSVEGKLNEGCKQQICHFGTKEREDGAKRLHKNPDKDLPWDKYKEKREKENDDRWKKLSDRDRHMFDDDHWTEKEEDDDKDED